VSTPAGQRNPVGTLHLLSKTLVPQLLNHFPIMKQAISDYLKSLFPLKDFKVSTRLDSTREGVQVVDTLGFFTEPTIKSLISYASKHGLHFYVSATAGMVEFHLYK